MNDLHSALAQPIADFLHYKQALNKKYQTETLALRLFDSYLFGQGITGWQAVTSSVIDAFMASRSRHRPRSYNHLLGVLRRFFDWAVLQRWINQNPVVERSKRETGKRLPYLFDLTTARRILAVASGLPDTPKGPQRALVYETVFALLYGLGLRVGEVARLTVGDVDFTGNILCIRETKFSKHRWVPFGPNMANRLRRYCDQRYGETAATETPLFSFTQGRHIHPCTISQTFHKLLPQLELQLPPGVAPPRVHDLRHSFAVGTLLHWYREGVDPNRRLIHLATFLGHVDPNSTAVYLTITDELLREAAQRFHAFAQPGELQ
ncbi:MAG: tyrosine-type recombinase/integrase [Methylococcales bacterium]|nr:tyrosine-type recombinase/integrase [Methylococcales bacterium]